MKKENRVTVLYQNNSDSGPGRISLAAHLYDSNGLPPDTLRRLHCYALVYLHNGSGQYRDLQGERRVSAGNLLILFPGVPHQYGPGPGEKWDEFFVFFNGPLFDLWLTYGLFDPARPVLRINPVKTGLIRLENICSPRISQIRQICLLQEFMADALAGSRQTPEVTADSQWREQVEAIFKEHPELSPEEAAEKIGMSYEIFRHRFKLLTGIPPGRFCAQKKIERSAKLLLESSLPIKQIAANLGFCDEFYFSRAFKKIMGISPGAWRRQLPGAGL